MELSTNDIASMLDLSCVRTYSSKDDIRELALSARNFPAGQASVLQCFIPLTRELLRDAPQIHVVGNVSFPSGSDTTSLKVTQAKEMVEAGCDEIDMVMNVGLMLSKEYCEVEKDIRAVLDAIGNLTTKVIIERPYLNEEEVRIACEMCIRCGATFVKTGTGWADRGTTIEDVRLIKSIVGDRIKIKASGGIRNLDTLLAMYREGARRFGVNLKSGNAILEECKARGGSIQI